jgi:hypothetical protein
MTTKQRGELDEAIERAMAAGVEVCGHGRMKANNERVYVVPSQRDRTHWHLVRLVGSRRLVCDCEASQRSRICVHRAAVHMHLVVAAAVREAAAERVTSALEQEARGIEARDRAEAEAAAERDRKRDTAVLVRSNAPFSIWR